MQRVAIVVCDLCVGTVPMLAENVARYLCGTKPMNRVYLLLSSGARTNIPREVRVIQRYYHKEPIEKVVSVAKECLAKGMGVDFYFFDALAAMKSIQIELFEFASYCSYRCVTERLEHGNLPTLGTVYVPFWEKIRHVLGRAHPLKGKGRNRARVYAMPVGVNRERGSGVFHLVNAE